MLKLAQFWHRCEDFAHVNPALVLACIHRQVSKLDHIFTVQCIVAHHGIGINNHDL
jgi:hypothetical protein